MWTKRTAPDAPQGRRGPAAWHWARQRWGLLLGLAVLALAGTACDPVGNISVDAPVASTGSNAYFVDTLTVRLATVWHDSVATSGTDNLLVGRYRDPRLGTITARSYVRVGLGATYAPDADEVFDSVVLVLKPDAFRYGDTTQLQKLEVHRLRAPLLDAKTYYSFSQLAYDAAVLNQGTGLRSFKAQPSLRTLRLRLDNALGLELLNAGKAGRLTTEAELYDRLAGLVLTPAATDDAALLRGQASTEGAALNVYTHLPPDPLTAIARGFTLAAGAKHFYQVTADRTGTLLAPLTTSLQALDVARTAQETYIDGVLGLQTKVEIPYLKDLRTFGSRVSIVQAYLTLEVVPGSTTRYLAPSTTLTPYLCGRGNQQGLVLANSGVAISIPYQSGVSKLTGLETGTYDFPITDYCQAVVDQLLDNKGILLESSSPTSPERVVLGGPKRSENRLKLGLYFLSH